MLKLHDFSNRAVLTERGRASRFSCNYHNWVYRNDGSLMGVPDEANFFDLDKKNCGLVPIATDVWEGWIFLNHQTQDRKSRGSGKRVSVRGEPGCRRTVKENTATRVTTTTEDEKERENIR